jgi:MFS transporter, DHA2 family, multidrug resistance protein
LNRPAPVGEVAAALGFAALCLGMFMAILDVQIVATALPTLEHALAIAPQDLSWIQTAYLLAEIVSIPLTGPFQRIFGLRRIVATALVVFTAASLGCAASPTLAWLVGWRLVQGFAGGTLIPLVFGSVFLLFEPRRQSLATALAGMVAVLAPTVGPLVGGTVTVAWSWHALFLINLPLGLVAILGAVALLPAGPAAQGSLNDLDGIALVLMSAALAGLVLALKQAPEAGWGALATLALFAGSGLCGTLFVRRTLADPRPLVALRLLGDRTFAVGCGLSFVFGLGLFGSVYLMPLFLGIVRGHDPREIGLIMLVTGVAQLAAAPLVAWLEPRFDARLLTSIGFVLFAAGLAL